MGGPYRAIPVGNDKLAATLKAIKASLSSQQTAAGIRNAAITGGDGLTVQDPSNGQAIQLQVVPGGTSSLLFYPPTAQRVLDWAAIVGFDPDGSYGGGELTLSSPASPAGGFDGQPAQTGFINLTSGDGASGGLGSVGLQADTVAIQVLGSGFGNPARIVLGIIGTFANIQEDATSWRIQAGDAQLVFPQATSEIRVRDVNNANYTVIRASAFTVTSTREAKQDIRDFGWSPAQAVADAPAFQYRYRDGHADPSRLHFGPMAEDLPAEMVDHTDPDVPAVNAVDMIGVLWGAVGEQQAIIAAQQDTIAALTERVAALEAQRAIG